MSTDVNKENNEIIWMYSQKLNLISTPKYSVMT